MNVKTKKAETREQFYLVYGKDECLEVQNFQDACIKAGELKLTKASIVKTFEVKHNDSWRIRDRFFSREVMFGNIISRLSLVGNEHYSDLLTKYPDCKYFAVSGNEAEPFIGQKLFRYDGRQARIGNKETDDVIIAVFLYPDGKFRKMVVESMSKRAAIFYCQATMALGYYFQTIAMYGGNKKTKTVYYGDIWSAQMIKEAVTSNNLDKRLTETDWVISPYYAEDMSELLPKTDDLLVINKYYELVMIHKRELQEAQLAALSA